MRLRWHVPARTRQSFPGGAGLIRYARMRQTPALVRAPRVLTGAVTAIRIPPHDSIGTQQLKSSSMWRAASQALWSVERRLKIDATILKPSPRATVGYRMHRIEARYTRLPRYVRFSHG